MAYKTAAELFGDGGVWGAQVPIDTGAPSGPYDPTNRGIGFGEQLTSAIANRSHYALGLNTDDLNNRVAVWETGGLNAAYDLGAAAVPGGGRNITKDAGAVETNSTLATLYTDDPTNAHFRADARGDTTPGGGFDFVAGVPSVGPAYGYLSRIKTGININYTTISADEAVTLNPGGLGGDIVRFAVPVMPGGKTDVGLNGLDFLELTGAGALNGLYVIYSSGPANTDWRVRKLDGAAPTFTANLACTASLNRGQMMSSANGRLLGGVGGWAALALGATQSDNVALALYGNDEDGVATSGLGAAIAFLSRKDTGEHQWAATFTSTGRYISTLSDGTYSSAEITKGIARLYGGLSNIQIDKNFFSTGQTHEVGLLMTDIETNTSSMSAVEAHGGVVSTTLGLDASINGTFASPMGRVILPDSDGTPAPPSGQLKTFWPYGGAQPGMSLVRFETGAVAGAHYLIKEINLTAAGPNADEMVLVHLDGSALDVGELPTVGSCTFRFINRSRFGGRQAAIDVDTLPSQWPYTVPANVIPSVAVMASSDGGSTTVAAAFWGSLVGVTPFKSGTTLPATVSADIPWVITGGGDFIGQGDVLVDGEVSAVGNVTGAALEATVTPHITIPQTDYYVHMDMRIGQPEHTAAGVPCWRFDRANGYWELIDLNGGPDSAIYFPITFRGKLMTTDLQVWESTALQYVYSCLQITTPDWATPSNPLGVNNANEATYIGGGANFATSTISHSLGLGTNIDLATKAYAIRVRATSLGSRVRAIRHSVRYTSIVAT